MVRTACFWRLSRVTEDIVTSIIPAHAADITTASDRHNAAIRRPSTFVLFPAIGTA